MTSSYHRIPGCADTSRANHAHFLNRLRGRPSERFQLLGSDLGEDPLLGLYLAHRRADRRGGGRRTGSTVWPSWPRAAAAAAGWRAASSAKPDSRPSPLPPPALMGSGRLECQRYRLIHPQPPPAAVGTERSADSFARHSLVLIRKSDISDSSSGRPGGRAVVGAVGGGGSPHRSVYHHNSL